MVTCPVSFISTPHSKHFFLQDTNCSFALNSWFAFAAWFEYNLVLSVTSGLHHANSLYLRTWEHLLVGWDACLFKSYWLDVFLSIEIILSFTLFFFCGLSGLVVLLSYSMHSFFLRTNLIVDLANPEVLPISLFRVCVFFCRLMMASHILNYN